MSQEGLNFWHHPDHFPKISHRKIYGMSFLKCNISRPYRFGQAQCAGFFTPRLNSQKRDPNVAPALCKGICVSVGESVNQFSTRLEVMIEAWSKPWCHKCLKQFIFFAEFVQVSTKLKINLGEALSVVLENTVHRLHAIQKPLKYQLIHLNSIEQWFRCCIHAIDF